MTAPRSVLYVPASRPEMLAKVVSISADAVLVDLEDGVAPAAKEAARAHLRAAAAGFGRPWGLRINPPGTAWHAADVHLAAALRPSRLVLPKAERAAEVAALGAAGAVWGAALGIMIESAAGVARATELAAAHPAVDMLLAGSADLRLGLGAPADPERGWERHALAAILVAARSVGAAAIDGVYVHLHDAAGLTHDAGIGRSLGFDGKSCIHPAQIAVIHAAFRSAPGEVAWARRVLAAWDEQDGGRRGVVVAAGEMIEALHLALARRILERA